MKDFKKNTFRKFCAISVKKRFPFKIKLKSELQMKTPKSYRYSPGKAPVIVSLLVATSLVCAQEEREQPIFDLSPFTIDASEDTGYTATSTLAGTRIRTDLKDLGSAISVVTTELMGDISATDASTLLSYTANTEVGGYQGNFSGGETNNVGRVMQTDARTNPQLNQRVRGLGNADLTRGFFLTDIGFDSYNTDRVEVSRGPNSLLFGIGSPGGVINNSPKSLL